MKDFITLSLSDKSASTLLPVNRYHLHGTALGSYQNGGLGA